LVDHGAPDRWVIAHPRHSPQTRMRHSSNHWNFPQRCYCINDHGSIADRRSTPAVTGRRTRRCGILCLGETASNSFMNRFWDFVQCNGEIVEWVTTKMTGFRPDWTVESTFRPDRRNLRCQCHGRLVEKLRRITKRHCNVGLSKGYNCSNARLVIVGIVCLYL